MKYDHIAQSWYVGVSEGKSYPIVLANSQFWGNLDQNVVSNREKVKSTYQNILQAAETLFFVNIGPSDLENDKQADHVCTILCYAVAKKLIDNFLLK